MRGSDRAGGAAGKMGDSAYSFSLTTFSPQGKLLQIEHALNAVNKKGKISLGIRAKDGVVLATSRKVPQLVDLDGFHKVNIVSENVGMVYSGEFGVESGQERLGRNPPGWDGFLRG